MVDFIEEHRAVGFGPAHTDGLERWSSQDLVDAWIWLLRSRLRIVRTDPADMLMPPRSIVKRLNVIRDIVSR